MAISLQVYNQATGNRRSISAEIEVAYIQEDTPPPAQDFYVKMTVSGLDLLGRPIGPYFLTSLADLPDNGGTQQHPGGSGDPFASFTAQMENFIRRAMEGDTTIANSAMDF